MCVCVCVCMCVCACVFVLFQESYFYSIHDIDGQVS